MKKIFFLLVVAFSATNIFAQLSDDARQPLKATHEKFEYRIPMRDGTKLFTIVYVPKDKSRNYPFLMNRTCYNASNYGSYNSFGHPSDFLISQGYILVFQDVRGRYMSDGVFNNMTPNIPGNNPKNKKDIDESSDTYDSIDWLLKNIKNNNGRVGIYGTSYPGFYSSASLPDAHPALKAVSPQAPIADFFFDDFHHNGAFLQSYTSAFGVFGYQKTDTTRTDEWLMEKLMRFWKQNAKDGYEFYQSQGLSLQHITDKYHYDNFFWKQIIDHPNYDTFWQRRNLLPHLKNVKPATLVVGGWFDAEDLYGPINTFKTIAKNSPGQEGRIVMGPWSHGGWARETGRTKHYQITFGDSISTWYQREVEAPFFNFYLQSKGQNNLPTATMFNTGTKKWERYNQWPPADAKQYKFYFGENGKLSIDEATNANAAFEYISDPHKPVPYTSQIEGLTFTPSNYMSDDQRYASRRPDVLTFETDVLKEDITIAGEILAKLKVSTTGTDADFFVKLIDVYPDNMPQDTSNPKNIIMAGYQQLVRSEAMRARFRNSFEKPEPFVPNQITDVNVPLQDVLHTFKKGHRIMVQIHSTWFPFVDRNPQKYVDNIYKAKDEDFIKAFIKVYGSSVVTAGGKR